MSNETEQPQPATPPGASDQRPRLVQEPIVPEGAGSYGYGYNDNYGEVAGSSGPPDAMFYARMVHRRRWTVATVFAIVLIATVFQSFTSVPIYEARVRVLTDNTQLNLVSVPDVMVQNRADTQQAILRSRWLAKRTLQAMQLLPGQNPTVATALPPPPAPSNFALVRSWVSQAKAIVTAPYRWVVDPPQVVVEDFQSGETPAEAAAISGFLSGLVLPTPQTGLMEIGYRSPDPVRAATFANALTQAYIDMTIETRSTAGREVSDWLAARLTEQRGAIAASEQALQAFRDANGIAATGDGERPTAIDDRLSSLNSSIIRAQSVVIEKEAQFKQLQSLRSKPGSAETLAALLPNPAVQDVRQTLATLVRERTQAAENLGDRHPEMLKLNDAIQRTQAQLKTEIDRAVQALAADLSVAEDAASKLERAADTEKQAALAMNKKSTELRILERDVESTRQIYQMLAQRARETSLAEKVEPRLMRVLDPAQVPRVPVAPNKARNLMLGALSGLILGVVLAFGFEFLDNRIKHPEQIEALLKIPFLGLVPALRPKGNERPPIVAGKIAPPPFFVEAIRRIRTNVLFSFAGEGSKVIVVTSATAGEGKTLISSNLAAALAQAGQRVLVIDADMRRPRQHIVFGKPKEPGLSHLLVGKSKLSDVTLQTTIQRLYVMPSGHRPPNAAELLGSPAFKKVLVAVREHFDWVVIDSPPVMAVTDAEVAAHVADGVVFVIGAEMPSSHVVKGAIDQCRVANVNVIGAVLNRVELEKHSYYYSRYYHPRYNDYFTDDADSGTASKSA